ncbi:MAG: 50S ribosomal protein L29 [Hyphomonadaceae bacterium]
MKLRDIRKEMGDLRGGDAAKVADELADLKKEQFNLRFQQATGQLEKSSRMRDVRRMVARAKTVLREKQPPKAKV